MDPIHLKRNELEYELAIRNALNVGNHRVKTSSLRSFLEREESGLQSAPKNSLQFAPAESEIQVCHEIYTNISEKLTDPAIGSLGLNECISRLYHVQLRLERIVPLNPEQIHNVEELLNCTYEALHKLSAPAPISPQQRTPGRNSLPNISNADKSPHLTSHSVTSRSNVGSPLGAIGGSLLNNLDNQRKKVSAKGNPQFSVNSFPRSGDRVDIPSLFENRHENFPIINESLFDISELSPQEADDISNEIGRVPNIRAPIVRPSNGVPTTRTPISLQKEFNTNKPLGKSQYHPIPILRNSLRTPQVHYTQDNENASAFVSSNPRQYEPRNISHNFDYINHNTHPRYNPHDHYKHHEVDHLRFPHNDNVRQYVPQPNYSRYENEMPRQFNHDPLVGYTGEIDRRNRQTQVRKPVPVHQWRLSYSGDSRGLHLYDFISQVTLYQRAEGISDYDLFCSFIHLLTGRAKLWYQAVYDSFRNWQEIVEGLKKEFLPPNYEYILLTDISNRLMKSTETFAEYITHMKSLFKCLSIPITEEHKLFLVQKNLLPRYAIGVAPLEIRSLQQLTEVCRRIDGAVSRPSINIPFQGNQSFTRSYPRFNDRYREVNMLEDTEDQQYDTELFEVRNARNVNQAQGDSVDRRREGRRVLTCWNCRTTGHSFQECRERRRGTFCYKCGEPDVITPQCQKCSENSARNPGTNRAAQVSEENRPQ